MNEFVEEKHPRGTGGKFARSASLSRKRDEIAGQLRSLRKYMRATKNPMALRTFRGNIQILRKKGRRIP